MPNPNLDPSTLPKSHSENDPRRVAEILVEVLARALHRYGTPAHRLEEAMGHVASGLGLQSQFFSTPTAIFASLGTRGHQRTLLIRVEPGEIELEKLSRLDAVLTLLARGDITPATALGEVEAIEAAAPRYGTLLTTLAFALASASAACFFGGGGMEILGAGGAGLLIGLLAAGLQPFAHARRLFEPLAALGATALATMLAIPLAPMAHPVVILAGLIVLIPGLSLTVAMKELATRNLISGSGRLAWAALVFLAIGFGVALGDRLARALVGPLPAVEPTALPDWSLLLALPVSAAAFTVLFRALPRDMPWILAASAMAVAGSRLGAAALGAELGALVGALLVGAGSNLFSRLLNRPAAIIQLPGLILLVPGSIGFRSIAALLEGEILFGVETAFEMTLVAVALVTGLLLANVLVPPRRDL